MSKKMLIDAAHAEETRVVVVDGNRVEEFDFESQNRKQLRGNIYLAKVTRVEPSLQAAFVEYGGNRHGFLAFNEIHPDYYQIPVADREALMCAEEEAEREDHAEVEVEEVHPEASDEAPAEAAAAPAEDDHEHDEEDAQAMEALRAEFTAEGGPGAAVPLVEVVPAAAEGEILDTSTLRNLREMHAIGGDGVLNELLALYRQEFPRLIADMREAAASQDLEKLALSACTLRGSAGNYGARRLVQLCAELEGYAKNGQVKQLEAPLLRLDEAYQQALEAFGREFPGLG